MTNYSRRSLELLEYACVAAAQIISNVLTLLAGVMLLLAVISGMLGVYALHVIEDLLTGLVNTLVLLQIRLAQRSMKNLESRQKH